MSKRSKVIIIEDLKNLPADIKKKIKELGYTVKDYSEYSRPGEAKAGKEELQKVQAFLSSIVENIPDMIFVKDAKDLRFTLFNKAGEKLLGQKMKDLIGKNDYDLFTKKQADSFTGKDREVLKNKKPVDIPEESIKTMNGDKILHTKKVPILDEKGKPAYLLGISEDITAKKELEKNMRKIEKLESMGTLAGGIAHDFNNILTTILGNLSIIKMDVSPGEERYESLVEMQKATLQAKELANQLLTFSRGETPDKRLFSLAKFLKDSVKYILSKSLSKPEFFIPSGLWTVKADEAQLTRVIDNIITNASQSMPEGGPVSISAKNTVIRDENYLNLPGGNYVKISIQDHGHGISREDLPRIFDPYFTIKKNQSGMGLSIAYSIIKKHKGEILVESEPGKGSAFIIYLPSSVSRDELSEQKEKIQEGTGRILVLDDDIMVQKSAGRILKRLGYEVAFAKDGSEAIRKYKKEKASGRFFDAVVLDLTIQDGMGGGETISKLKKIDPKIRAIVSSGYSDDPIMSNYKEYGFIDVIPKPYTIQEMSRILQKVLKK
ncbi:MAG: response regulator [Spirochaetes bacterium]|nr:response regulator [Spirochaetota bacterium]